MRRSELAGLDVADVEQVPDGLLIHLRHSKTPHLQRPGLKVELQLPARPTLRPHGPATRPTWTRTVNQFGGPLPAGTWLGAGTNDSLC